MIKPVSGATVWMGYRGENLARVIQFDLTDLLAEYPGASCELLVENGSGYYVATTTVAGGVMTWRPHAADLQAAGWVNLQIRAALGSVVVKTVMMVGSVSESVGGTQGDPPSVYEGWEDTLIAAKNGANAAAAAATTAAAFFPAGGTTGQVLKKHSGTDYDTEWADGSGSADPNAVHYTAETKTASEKAQARANIGAGTSDFSGSYDDLIDKPDTFPPSTHTHDDRYYTETETDTLLGAKQDTISDLSTIRSGAAAGATALQSVPDTYRTAAEQDAIHDSTKQDTISDLETIRSGAALGATAYQKPASGIPAADMASGVIPDVSGKVDKAQGVAHAGEFLVVGADGNVTTQAVGVWQGGEY